MQQEGPGGIEDRRFIESFPESKARTGFSRGLATLSTGRMQLPAASASETPSPWRPRLLQNSSASTCLRERRVSRRGIRGASPRDVRRVVVVAATAIAVGADRGAHRCR